MNYRERYLFYLQSEAWQKTRQKVYDRQQGVCFLCHKHLMGRFDCHHCHYRHIGTQRDSEACVAVHRSCHELLHQKTWAELQRGFDKL